MLGILLSMNCVAAEQAEVQCGNLVPAQSSFNTLLVELILSGCTSALPICERDKTVWVSGGFVSAVTRLGAGLIRILLTLLLENDCAKPAPTKANTTIV